MIPVRPQNDLMGYNRDLTFRLCVVKEELGVEEDILQMFSDKYQEHKQRFGSLRDSDNYIAEMKARYDWMFSQTMEYMLTKYKKDGEMQTQVH